MVSHMAPLLGPPLSSHDFQETPTNWGWDMLGQPGEGLAWAGGSLESYYLDMIIPTSRTQVSRCIQPLGA